MERQKAVGSSLFLNDLSFWGILEMGDGPWSINKGLTAHPSPQQVCLVLPR